MESLQASSIWDWKRGWEGKPQPFAELKLPVFSFFSKIQSNFGKYSVEFDRENLTFPLDAVPSLLYPSYVMSFSIQDGGSVKRVYFVFVIT